MTGGRAIIVGAGPAGLTAAYELQARTEIAPVVLEASGEIGGISKTVKYKGNRLDIGGHRFFSQSDRVMRWWQNILPLQGQPSGDDIALGRDVPLSHLPGAPDPRKTDKVMLVRKRLSRILHRGRLYDYPVSLSYGTLRNLGALAIIKIASSYLKASVLPIRPERTLEEFFVNRFGRELYLTFFKDYTEKVWGLPCSQIKPEWGAQRIKGFSLGKAISSGISRLFRPDRSIAQKKTATTLIERFLYPKLGPGQLWEEVARLVEEHGGQVQLRQEVIGVECSGNRVEAVRVLDRRSGRTRTQTADFFFSSMPVRDLIEAMGQTVPPEVRQVALGLPYRDFITIGLLVNKLLVRNQTRVATVGNLIPDNWIYIQEPGVRLGRLQIFNNWSPYMVADPEKVWLGLEYFCSQTDPIWRCEDQELIAMAGDELARIGLIDKKDVLDGVAVRVPKAYPTYSGTYAQFDVVRRYLDRLENLFLIGRNGMHRYNNQDHSMLAAMTAVEVVAGDAGSRQDIWRVNSEDVYCEEK